MHFEETIGFLIYRIYIVNFTLISSFQTDNGVLPAGDKGTYFCVKHMDSIDENIARSYGFQSAHPGSTSAASFAYAWKQMMGDQDVDFLYHLDGNTINRLTDAY